MKNYSNECCLNCKYLDYAEKEDICQCLKDGSYIEFDLKTGCGDFVQKDLIDEPIVTDDQLRIMQHIIGYDYNSKPYRNYAYFQAIQPDLEDLIQKGFMGRKEASNGRDIIYYLTKTGLEHVRNQANKAIIFKIAKTSDIDYEEVLTFNSLKQLLEWREQLDEEIIIVNSNEIEIYDGWRE